MAKPFYSMDEVCAKLGKKPDEIKELVRAGTLREFRDAGKVFFKAEDVEQLAGGGKGGPSDSGEILLEPAEDASSAAPEEGLPPLTSSSGGTSIIGLEPLEEEKEEKKEDTVITASGIGVFDEDELEIDADPMAKTQITAGPVGDQVSLESSGSSGSGLLDLTRESDDTSLGAELLDEIYPGEEETAAAEPRAAAPVKAAPPPEEEAELTEAEAGEVVVPVIVAAGDPYEGLFSGLLVAALILLAMAGSVVGGVLQGFLPDYTHLLTGAVWILPAVAVGVLVISGAIGWFVGRATSSRRA